MFQRLFTLLLALVLAGCSAGEDWALGPGPDRIVRLADAEIKGLDPQLVSDLASLRVARDQFVGLTRFDAAGEAIPGLAGPWTVSGDGLVWTFPVRDDARFSDGQRIDAETFVRLFERLRDEAVAVPNRALFDPIESFAASGGEVVVTLRAPYPELPALLAQPALAAIPLHRIEAAGDGWTAERPLVTSGPYRLAEWRLNDHVRLEPNPEWTGEPVGVSGIIWRPMDDSLSAMRLFLASGADVASDYPASRHGWLMENHARAVRNAPYLGSYYFAFNTREPPFDDVRVRRALAMTVEREWIAEKVMAIGNEPAWSLLPPGLVADKAYRPDWADWPRDRRLEAARNMLAAAGYGPDTPLAFEIRINSSAEHRRVAVALAEMWRTLGVEASVFNSEAALHFASLRQHDFTLARSGWIADLPTPDNFLSVHLAVNGAGNYSGYDSPRYARKLAEALATADPDARAQAMAAAERQLVADMPILPLYFYVTRSLVSPRIGGWTDNASNIHPSSFLRIE